MILSEGLNHRRQQEKKMEIGWHIKRIKSLF